MKNSVNINNYEEYMLDYVDDELSAKDKENFLQFLQQNPHLQKELKLLQSTKMPADDEIVFPYKQQLYHSKTSDKKKVIVLNKVWLGAAVAASIALLVIAYFSINNSYKSSTEIVVNNKIPKQETDTFNINMPLPVQPTVPKKQSHLAVTGHPGKKTKHKKDLPEKPEIKQPDTSTTLYTQTNAEKENSEKIIPIVPVKKLFEKDTTTILKEADLAERDHQEIEKKISLPAVSESSVRENKEIRSQHSFAYTKENIDSTITDKIVDFQDKISHPLKTLNVKKIKIGNISFVFKH